MSGMNLRTLSNRELVRYASMDWNPAEGLPVEMQRELLRRFTELAPMDEHPVHDSRQQDLFLSR